jgi:hypothetical protein
VAAVRSGYKLRRRRLYDFWLFFIQRNVASPAKVIGCAKLNQKAMVAPDNLPGIDRGKISGHLQVGVARADNHPRNSLLSSSYKVICGTRPVEVKRIRSSILIRLLSMLTK